MFGYRRVLSPHDTLEGNAVVGLRSALSVTSTRQVGAPCALRAPALSSASASAHI